jgi:demethylmenaquinone methyltransferase/2-methoxy-6-polyprenyl-1,4-benzoquinol methylase
MKKILFMVLLTFSIPVYSQSTDPYYVRMVDSEMKRNPESWMVDFSKKLKWNYCHGLELGAILDVGRKKIEAKGLENSITLKQQDCREMNFPNDTFDAVTVAFGVRNFENINASFREIHRVLKPDGIFLFLELSTPQHFPMKQLYTIYSKFFIPFIGRLISSDKNAYNYLPQSISAFPQGKKMMAILEKNDFYILQYKTYTAGVCSLYIAQKRA